MKVFALAFIITLTLLACDPSDSGEDVVVPTLADPVAVRTAQFLTQNAPPPGFDSVAYNPVDFNRDQLPGSEFQITVNFDGQYSETGEDVTGSMVMRVEENRIQRSRRVVLSFIGDVMAGELSEVEAVRIENTFYIKTNDVCTTNDEAAREIATLEAGRVVGGVTLAIPTGQKDEILGFESFQYGFAQENLNFVIFNQVPTAVEVQGGEVWVIPEHDVVARFGASFFVHEAQILFGDEPVTGNLRYEYNLNTIATNDTLPNISVPNGC